MCEMLEKKREKQKRKIPRGGCGEEQRPQKVLFRASLQCEVQQAMNLPYPNGQKDLNR